jgi:hypothetical protein
MSVYDGFAENYEPRGRVEGAKVIDFSSVILPNGTSLPSKTYQCLADCNQSYKNIVIWQKVPYTDASGCTVSNDNIASGFTKTSGLKILRDFPSQINQLKILLKFTLPSFTFVPHNDFLTNNDTDKGIDFYISRYLYFGYRKKNDAGEDVQTLGTSSVARRSTFWVKIEKVGSSYVGSHLTDAGYDLDTVETQGTFIEDWRTDDELFAGCRYNIGYSETYSANYFLGTADLNNCAIWCNDELFWNHELIAEYCEAMNGCLYECEYENTADNSFYCYYDYAKKQFLLTSSDSTFDDAEHVYLGEMTLPSGYGTWNYENESWTS